MLGITGDGDRATRNQQMRLEAQSQIAAGSSAANETSLASPNPAPPDLPVDERQRGVLSRFDVVPCDGRRTAATRGAEPARAFAGVRDAARGAAPADDRAGVQIQRLPGAGGSCREQQ